MITPPAIPADIRQRNPEQLVTIKDAFVPDASVAAVAQTWHEYLVVNTVLIIMKIVAAGQPDL